MTSPLHGENPGFKSPWAHLLMIILDPNTARKYMKIELDATENDAYTNFTELIRSAETRHGYARNLA